MKLAVSTRASAKKCEAKKLRRSGSIPAVLYSKGKIGEAIAIESNEFQRHLNTIQKGQLSTTVFTLTNSEGKERKAILKDIQYHITTYNIIHLDFEELHDNLSVNVKVPLEFTGVADCVGIKLGGVLRPVIRYIKVNCKDSKNIPTSFKVDVKNLKIKDTKRLRDISLPEGVRPLASNMDEVIVVIAKR